MLDLIKHIIQFRDERNWSQFHTAQNLAVSISIEAAELLENFQWKTNEEALNSKRTEICEEIADVLIYCLLLCDRIGINPKEAIIDKLEKNRAKYPVEKAFDSAKKYNEL